MNAGAGRASRQIAFLDALWVWLRVAALSFGGPAGQIAVMHRILVEEKRWISENRFLHALNYCMLLPGPEAQQLATYTGWLLYGTIGGLTAGSLFILPGFLSVLLLSVLYAGYRDLTLVEALFYGLAPAVIALVVEAVWKIGTRALRDAPSFLLAAAAFLAMFFWKAPFPLIVVLAGVWGWISGLSRGKPPSSDNPEEDAYLLDQEQPAAVSGGRRAIQVTVVFAVLWLGPLLLLRGHFGSQHIYYQQGLFFSKLAVVTFGGAYAALAYMAQEAVEVYGWLQPGQMLDGLGMAETTPGPLIQVVQFVGFMGAYQAADNGMLGHDPLAAGIFAAVATTWFTFVPCFLWIFLGAPYIEKLRGNRHLTAALSGITAAVVGVILNLAVWFFLHTIFGQVGELVIARAHVPTPDFTTLDGGRLAIAGFAFLALFYGKIGMIPTLLLSVAGGLLVRLWR